MHREHCILRMRLPCYQKSILNDQHSQLLREQTQAFILDSAMCFIQWAASKQNQCHKLSSATHSYSQFKLLGFDTLSYKSKTCFTAPVLHNHQGKVMGKKETLYNAINFTHYDCKSQEFAYCSSADLCVKSPVGAVMDESVVEGGAHSTAYCLTATVSIWLRAHSRLFLPWGASERWATRGSFPHTVPDALPQRRNKTISHHSGEKLFNN